VGIKIIKKGQLAAHHENGTVAHNLHLLKGAVPAKLDPIVHQTGQISNAGQTSQPMRRDKQQRHERLCALIEQTISHALPGGRTFELEGHVWAVRTLSEWASLLGVKSIDTVSDLIKIAPIQRDYTQVDGKKALLLRVGEPGPISPRKIANLMRGVFRNKTGREPKPEEFPLLKVLASEWPTGLQVDIFKVVLDNWTAFKAAVAIAIEEMKARGEKAYHRHHSYPSVSVICKFRDVALGLYLMHVQENAAAGRAVPDVVIQAFPKLFQHLKKP